MTDPISSPAPRGWSNAEPHADGAPVVRVLAGDDAIVFAAFARDDAYTVDLGPEHWAYVAQLATVEVRAACGADRAAGAAVLRAAIEGLRDALSVLTGEAAGGAR